MKTRCFLIPDALNPAEPLSAKPNNRMYKNLEELDTGDQDDDVCIEDDRQFRLLNKETGEVLDLRTGLPWDEGPAARSVGDEGTELDQKALGVTGANELVRAMARARADMVPKRVGGTLLVFALKHPEAFIGVSIIKTDRGFMVCTVEPDGCAADQGILAGDYLVRQVVPYANPR